MNKLIRCLVTVVGALALSSSFAQTWPSKPIRFINPYAPGGFGDTVARPMFDQLAQALGQPIIVERQAPTARSHQTLWRRPLQMATPC